MAGREECGEARDNYQARWGLESGCGRRHPPLPDPIDLHSVGWVRLGKDTSPNACCAWVAKKYSIAWPWLASYRQFLRGMQDDVLVESANGTSIPSQQEYWLKIPGIENALPVTNEMQWRLAMHRLREQMEDNSEFWCETQYPILLACSREQEARYREKGWLDSVQLEKARVEEQEAREPRSDR